MNKRTVQIGGAEQETIERLKAEIVELQARLEELEARPVPWWKRVIRPIVQLDKKYWY